MLNHRLRKGAVSRARLPLQLETQPLLILTKGLQNHKVPQPPCLSFVVFRVDEGFRHPCAPAISQPLVRQVPRVALRHPTGYRSRSFERKYQTQRCLFR